MGVHKATVYSTQGEGGGAPPMHGRVLALYDCYKAILNFRQKRFLKKHKNILLQL